jgi:thiamine-phosphate pyrophosphorylase
VTICLVTDRRRCEPVAQAAQAAAAGIDLIQIREHDLEASALAAMVSAVLAAVRGTATRIVVNDRLDAAIACGGHGVHLRADSIPPADARRLTPRGFLVGRSVHSVDEAVKAAESVDYLIAGTVFATSSKPEGHALLGTDGLREIVRSVRVPVLAIGGVTRGRLAEVAAAGAAGIAAIGLFGGEMAAAPEVLRWRQLFDSARSAS